MKTPRVVPSTECLGGKARFSQWTLVIGMAILPSACCEDFEAPGIVVEIRDAVTRGPVLGAMLVVRSVDGAYADSSGGMPPPGDTLRGPPIVYLQSAFERPGLYDVTVRAPGYVEWSRKNVRVEGGVGCHVRTANLLALLQKQTPAPSLEIAQRKVGQSPPKPGHHASYLRGHC